MKSIVDAYIGLWIIMVFLMICVGFTSINLNIGQCRKMYNDIKAQVQAANGSMIDTTTNVYIVDSTNSLDPSTTGVVLLPDESVRTIKKNWYAYRYKITRKQLSSSNLKQADNETWIYNDIYRIEFYYWYGVPLFGTQEYKIVGYTY